ncbi:glutamine--fructose-6-phosphate aminotransferase [isomerizing] [Betaproteobacteria bacterium]|nr:glutamine--fructose-6-phosphate aminotransferase [isomerizing] [Betaproteobacteria bacterium]GHU01304.1 glutamine--fructose-6-phosphate aminotransferase [isomerizing] [Betaproteobacteria bacterium]GHU17280.1 glutamine--fructose-6-phosphate aminotransferase [isomerizing] [Betaproteobacteria bacterium]
MCGIVTAVATRNVVPVLLEGLRKLEYRGYDSVGLAVLAGGELVRQRSCGRVAELAARTEAQGLAAPTGIAHTRWATHGVPSERNAHPHISGGLAVVHNGIIENFETLKVALQARGYTFVSDTDSEVIAHLIHDKLGGGAAGLLEAVRLATLELVGAFAIGVIAVSEPDCVVVARRGVPLLLGLGEDGVYAASAASALFQVTDKLVFLEEDDLAELRRDAYRVVRPDGAAVERPVQISSLTADAVELGRFRHYMQKEIFEQPQALADTLGVVAGGVGISPRHFGAQAEEVFSGVRSVLILACGTSYHAGLVARYWLEAVAKLPCTVEIASEYRYRKSVADPDTLVVAVSQSGETADTLAALKYAQTLGMTRTLAICNVAESAVVREAKLRFITRAGPEIGVASTKAFTTQLAAFALLTLALARLRGALDAEAEARHLAALRHLPIAVQKVLDLEPQIERWAEHFATREHALFLGRGQHWPIAMEGALKLKEISYIHAEAYAAGELKHGPLALVDRKMPVIAVSPNDELLEKLKSNLQVVHARGGELYVFADAGSEIPEGDGVHIMQLPENYGLLSPILHVVPLQLLSYHVALVRGTDVDKPRNLAKSVTVE